MPSVAVFFDCVVGGSEPNPSGRAPTPRGSCHSIRSKEDILEHLVRDVTTAAASRLEAIATDPATTPADQLRQAVLEMIGMTSRQPSTFRLLVQSESAMPEKLAGEQARQRRRLLKHLVQIIEQGTRAGQFRPVDPRIAAFGIIGTWNWVAWWAGHVDFTGAAAEQLADTAVRGLLAEPHSSGTPTDAEALIGQLRDNLARLEAVVRHEAATEPG